METTKQAVKMAREGSLIIDYRYLAGSRVLYTVKDHNQFDL